MANARSRKRRGLTNGGVICIDNSKRKSKHKYLPFPYFIRFSDDTTSEGRAQYFGFYHKQRIELSKNRKFCRQNKGRQKPYRMHRCIKNLMDFSYW